MNETFLTTCWFWLKVLLLPTGLLVLMFVFGHSANASAEHCAAAMGTGVKDNTLCVNDR